MHPKLATSETRQVEAASLSLVAVYKVCYNADGQAIAIAEG